MKHRIRWENKNFGDIGTLNLHFIHYFITFTVGIFNRNWNDKSKNQGNESAVAVIAIVLIYTCSYFE